eukprot:2491837-Alexandrium_andersonii.AAC.1
MSWWLHVRSHGQLASASPRAPVEQLMLPVFPFSFPRAGSALHAPCVRVGRARVAPLVGCADRHPLAGTL